MGCRLFQVAGQQHGGGQGAVKGAVSHRRMRGPKPTDDGPAALGGLGFFYREAALAARDDGNFLGAAGPQHGTQGSAPPS